MSKLDKEERELSRTVDAEEWRSLPGKKRETTRYQEVAKATLRKDRRVNIRISSQDLEALKTRALEEGLPYQTLISSVLHKYVAASRDSVARQPGGRSRDLDEVAEAAVTYGKTDRAAQDPKIRREALVRLLEEEVWPRVPDELVGRGISKREREEILGLSQGDS